uniref:Uncharacterized protein n=1 Tax=Streptomyces avermitilis TaxID=33903 RepID=A0A499VUL0_STRAX|nr:hypothetical protein SAVMC3_84970 [Streptomyces avermitilis]
MKELTLLLRERWRVVVRLAAWSVLETGQTFLLGYALARALDEGFLSGRAGVGLGWLGIAGRRFSSGPSGPGGCTGVSPRSSSRCATDWCDVWSTEGCGRPTAGRSPG